MVKFRCFLVVDSTTNDLIFFSYVNSKSRFNSQHVNNLNDFAFMHCAYFNTIHILYAAVSYASYDSYASYAAV